MKVFNIFPEEILKEMFLLHPNLNRHVPMTNITDSLKFRNVSNNLPYLNEESADMDKDITLPELHSIILKSKINRSPGPDGFSKDFLKVSRPAG